MYAPVLEAQAPLPMEEALRLAEAAGRLGNVPVGAVAIHRGRVIARASNLRETLQDPTAHAEILVLREAARVLGTWRLDEVTLVVTLEPCAMCAGAIAHSRVRRLVYGTPEPRSGAVESTVRLLDDRGIDVETGVLGDRCAAMMTRFFECLRLKEG